MAFTSMIFLYIWKQTELLLLFACRTQSTTKKPPTTIKKNCKPGFISSFKGTSDKGYFVLPSNVPKVFQCFIDINEWNLSHTKELRPRKIKADLLKEASVLVTSIFRYPAWSAIFKCCTQCTSKGDQMAASELPPEREGNMNWSNVFMIKLCMTFR